MDELHYPQGHYLDQIHAYAKLQLTNEDAWAMRCTTFKDLGYVCKYMSIKERISVTKVYSALRFIGENSICYNKIEKFGILNELSRLYAENIMALDENLMDSVVFGDAIFSDVSGFSIRVGRDVCEETIDYANRCGIRTANLNMYYAMLGVRNLVENEKEYSLLEGSAIFDSVLSRLSRFEDAIRERINNARYGGTRELFNSQDGKTVVSYTEKFIQMNVDMDDIGLELVCYEYQMDIGRVDILCKTDDRKFVIVEVKKGIAGTDVIGQILKYICTFDGVCGGMIIASGFSRQVINAANKLNIDLVKYRVEVDENMEPHVEVSCL